MVRTYPACAQSWATPWPMEPCAEKAGGTVRETLRGSMHKNERMAACSWEPTQTAEKPGQRPRRGAAPG